jgi:hypothetical protein
MRRWMAGGCIGTYLLILVFGLMSHALGYQTNSHVGMYFIVWDMYCGWCGYEVRHHIIAQGDSGQYYEVTPAPWGEFVPFGSAERHHYDGAASFTGTIAAHILDHTDHEPITEVSLIEEAWSKKYNLPESIYERRYETPREKQSYFRTRVLLSSDGTVRDRSYDWTSWLSHQAVIDNPRLQKDMAGRPFLTLPEVQRVNYSTTRNVP